MKTYWDFTRAERAGLTEKQVEDMLDRELMTKGVLRVFPPVKMTVPEVKLEPKGKVYAIDDVAFSSAEEAEKAILAGVRKIDYTYDDVQRFYLQERVPEIQVRMIYDKADIDNAKKAIEKRVEAERSNRQELEEFEKASKAMNEVIGGVWQDWGECRDEAAKHRKVRTTFDKYKDLAEGNEETAMRFLKQTFSKPEIEAAWSWSDDELPNFDKAEATTAA